ncbi:hypothetical protein PM082_010986 [Marasmius tenuissimus]|nr:hypothetical protein PM082_010986 [Marasmius tenuissimus]
MEIDTESEGFQYLEIAHATSRADGVQHLLESTLHEKIPRKSISFFNDYTLPPNGIHLHGFTTKVSQSTYP